MNETATVNEPQAVTSAQGTATIQEPSSKDPPMYRVKDGLIEACVWGRKATIEGREKVFYNITLKTNFVVKEEGKEDRWDETSGIDGKNLLRAAFLLQNCHQWIVAQNNKR